MIILYLCHSGEIWIYNVKWLCIPARTSFQMQYLDWRHLIIFFCYNVVLVRFIGLNITSGMLLCACLFCLYLFTYLLECTRMCPYFAICLVKAKLEPLRKLKWTLLCRPAVQVSSIMVLSLLFHWCVVCFGNISLFTPRWCWHVWAPHALCSQAAEK